MQHPYVYGVLVFEAMATFVGQVSVLSLIALFGAATTAMVSIFHFLKTLFVDFSDEVLCLYIFTWILCYNPNYLRLNLLETLINV